MVIIPLPPIKAGVLFCQERGAEPLVSINILVEIVPFVLGSSVKVHPDSGIIQAVNFAGAAGTKLKFCPIILESIVRYQEVPICGRSCIGVAVCRGPV